MAITATVELLVLHVEDVSFKNKEGEGVSYREVLAQDTADRELVVLRAQDVSKFDGFTAGMPVTVQCSDDGVANVRVRKYRYQGPA